jgi:hypothetical protein
MLGRRLTVLKAGPGSAEAVAARTTEMMKDFMMNYWVLIVTEGMNAIQKE